SRTTYLKENSVIQSLYSIFENRKSQPAEGFTGFVANKLTSEGTDDKRAIIDGGRIFAAKLVEKEGKFWIHYGRDFISGPSSLLVPSHPVNVKYGFSYVMGIKLDQSLFGQSDAMSNLIHELMHALID
ncbi:hypothetical protein STEG23_014658, partial [Scotinomys teguina]